MSKLKGCPFCGGEPTKHVMPSVGGNIIIAVVRCERCKIEKKVAYSPGVINKPKDAAATAMRMASTEWNKRAEV